MIASPITAATLMDRFTREQEYIQRYLAFLQDKTLVTPVRVHRLEEQLVQLGLIERRGPLDTLHRTLGVRAVTSPYDWATLESIHTMIMATIPRIETALQRAESEVQQAIPPPQLNSVDSSSPLGELLQYALDTLEADSLGRHTYGLYQKPTKDEEHIQYAFDELESHSSDPRISRLYQTIKEQLEANQAEYGDEFEILDRYGNELSIDEAVNFAVAGAKYILPSRNVEQLLGVKQDVNEFDLTVRMSQPDAEINVFRQAFINLMTLFDATLFDTVRVAFRNDFFKVLPGFVTKDMTSVGDLSSYGSFERLRDEVAEQRLKSVYAKDLLFILQDKLRVELVDVKIGDIFIQLLELVLRRNIHLHNRGMVDDRYLELNSRGKPKYNIYNLDRGSVAAIDAPYWERANRLCKNAVDAAAQWADSLQQAL